METLRAAIDEPYTDTAWVGLRTRHYFKELASNDKPFFLFSSFWKPHSPYEVPTPYDEMYDDVEIHLPKLTTLEDIEHLPLPLQKLILHGKKPRQDMAREYLPREAVFSENMIPELITRGLDFYFEKGKGVKGIRYPDTKMIRTQRWKYHYYPDGYAELYDLENDPDEYQNLAGNPDHAKTEQEMKNKLLHWMVTADAPDQIAPKWLAP